MPRRTESRGERVERILDRAAVRLDRRRTAWSLMPADGDDDAYGAYLAARHLHWRLRDIVQETTCAHNRLGYGECSHSSEAELIRCEHCDNRFAATHSHNNPTGLPECYCAGCDVWHPRCVVVEECYDCNLRYCNDAEHSHSPVVEHRSARTNIIHGKPHPLATGERAVGVELEAENGTGIDELPSGCGVTEDGSLDAGVEVQTPPRSGDRLVETLTGACTALVNGGWDTGSGRCGTHVHLDMTEHLNDATYIARLFSTFYSVENILYALQSEQNRAVNSYSRPLHAGFDLMTARGMHGIKQLPYVYHGIEWDAKMNRNSKSRAAMYLESAKTQHYHESRYYGINLHAVPAHGTLEVRIHEGTLDSGRLLGWIDLLQSIVATVEHFPGYRRLAALDAETNPQRKVNAMRKLFAWTPAVDLYVDNYLNPGLYWIDPPLRD